MISAFLIVVAIISPQATARACGEALPFWCAKMLNPETCQIRISNQVEFGLRIEMEFRLRLQCEELRGN